MEIDDAILHPALIEHTDTIAGAKKEAISSNAKHIEKTCSRKERWKTRKGL
jgi:hypothetical protein